MQINRLFEITYILLNKKSITAKELAERLEVSTRTIYRDVEVLNESGIPIYTDKGRRGGIRLLDGFTLNKSIVSEEERKNILSSLQGMSALHCMDVDSVLSKLSAIFNVDNSNWIEVDFTDWSLNTADEWELIKKAILEKRVIEFEYYGSNREKSKRRVCPIKLWFKSKSWYLIAHCTDKNASRTFKLTRIKNSILTDDIFKLNKNENPVEDNGAFKPNIVNLKFHISNEISYRVYDNFPEECIIRNSDGSFTATMTCPLDEWVYGFILSFGSYLEVIEPQEVREEIVNRVKSTFKMYGL